MPPLFVKQGVFMKNGFIAFVFAPALFFGSFAHSALIEGHFYALTCGENEISTQVLPMDRSQVMASSSVTRVCHGHVLEQGTPVEVIRYEVSADQQSPQFVDFRVIERSLLAGRLNQQRGQARQLVIAAENPEFGRLQFQGLSLEGRFYSLQVVNNNPGLSFLNVQVPVMQEMLNIMMTPNETQSVLRGR